jgi:hypothetical protein
LSKWKFPLIQSPFVCEYTPFSNIYKGIVGYTDGMRDIVDKKMFDDRVDVLFNKIPLKTIYKTFNESKNGGMKVALVGSKLPQLMEINDISNDIKSFTRTNEKLYGKSDVDFAIFELDVNEYIKMAHQLIDILSIEQSYLQTDKCGGTGPKFLLVNDTTKIEIFRIKRTPLQFISNFHIDRVLCMWDMKDYNSIVMTRKCICALLTGVGGGMRWFSNNKPPSEVVFKNIMRGCSTMLNEKEMDCSIKMSPHSERLDQSLKKQMESPSSACGRFDLVKMLDGVPCKKHNVDPVGLHHMGKLIKYYNADGFDIYITKPPVFSL